MSLASGHSSLALAVTFLTALCHAFQITGLSGGVNASTGVRPARQEIDAFSESGPAFDLYILALLQFESVEQSDPLSYYQIAGAFYSPFIHTTFDLLELTLLKKAFMVTHTSPGMG